jgi:O-antigen/teichoic acid export membrane protein
MITIFVILIPAIAIIVFGGDILLQFFGKNYANEAFQFLRLYCISTMFTALLMIANAIMNVKRQIKLLVIVNVIVSALTLGLSYAFISGRLTGIGWGWAIGQAIAGLVSLFFIIRVFSTRSTIMRQRNIQAIGSRTIQDMQKELRSVTKPTIPVPESLVSYPHR